MDVADEEGTLLDGQSAAVAVVFAYGRALVDGDETASAGTHSVELYDVLAEGTSEEQAGVQLSAVLLPYLCLHWLGLDCE